MRDGALQPELKTTYTADKITYSATLDQPTGKLGLALTRKDLYYSGLTTTLSGSLPDMRQSGKVAFDLTKPHITVKGSTTVSSKPKIEIAATTGADRYVGGVTAAYDTSKSAITKWAAGAGYTADDYQATVFYNESDDVTFTVAHRARMDTTLAVEVTHNTGTKEFGLSGGMSRYLASGALQKFKIDHTGVLSVLHEQELAPAQKLSLSGQVNALDLSKPAKYGVGLTFKY